MEVDPAASRLNKIEKHWKQQNETIINESKQ
jgi:hypothetical protein